MRPSPLVSNLLNRMNTLRVEKPSIAGFAFIVREIFHDNSPFHLNGFCYQNHFDFPALMARKRFSHRYFFWRR